MPNSIFYNIYIISAHTHAHSQTWHMCVLVCTALYVYILLFFFSFVHKPLLLLHKRNDAF